MDDTPPQAALDHECRVLTSYLLRQAPSSYVLAKYRDAHAADALPASPAGPFDRLLARLAISRPSLLKLVDAYASVFFRTGLLRKKMVLLLAILEVSPRLHACFDSPDPGGTVGLLARIAVRSSAFLLRLLLAVVVLGPLQLAFALRSTLAAGPGRRDG
ncbi:MAG: hypothetical protein HY725_09600 [Candidatus Rokubacteria bacterium]|nr:hypothetical protein [Candidatus Rokubacteria bacterium]